MKNLAVFCGASSGADPVYTQAAITLGQWLVTNDWALVYGGSGVGLMGALGRTVLQAGGTVHGIMPENLSARGATLAGLAITVVPDMAVRKQQMLTLSDGCLALPGGPGTLEEIATAFSWARIGDYAKPCVFYNVNGYWDPLAAMFDRMVDAGFLTAEHRSKLLFSDDLDAVSAFMTRYTPPTVRTYTTH
ncbi:LOG family protein [Lacticaseibacillus daqingensis]|uniref:LOG family protein n=1 Tax=Lacticaseibacillus daqingensis TaxID=2486014 RepID=UPI000F798D52|nr:TIGR00730 family Rossman fold protein [Lacticaseibacillus daqingensis]